MDDTPHPLDPLTAGEYSTVLRVLREAGHSYDDSFFPLITLDEPVKSDVLSWKPGGTAARGAFVVLRKGRRTYEAVVDVAGAKLASFDEVAGVQPGLLLSEEWSAAVELVRAHAGWREAMGRRGIDDFDAVVPVPMTVGYFGAPRERAARLVKVVSFDGRDTENYWGRPIEGVVALVDLDEGSVVELTDTGVVPIPDGPVDFDAGSVGELRLAPNQVTLDQPQGPSFELDGQFVRWQKWGFHWRIDARLGPILSLVGYGSGDDRRSILYQGSLSEMFVPYTDPDTSWYFRAYMDAGEYGLGRLSSRLVPGLDCPANATFLHPLLADEYGNPFVQPRAACLFERYSGDVAWRHFEAETGATEARRATELVFRTVPTLGNYDYVIDWTFRQDGSIRISVGATGLPQVKAVPDGDSGEAYGRRVAENSVAINHDHFFSFRLDLDVDGRGNTLVVDRLETLRLEDETRSSTWVVNAETPATEKAAQLDIDLARPALWRVINPGVRGPQGHPVSYHLASEGNTVSLFAPDDIVRRRAGFTGHHLWVTPYRRDERYAAGAYPNQSRGGDGLPSWTDRDRPITDTDIVLWYTLGMHHVVRTEDWPVMPTTWSAFALRPFDFFARNPALDIPE